MRQILLFALLAASPALLGSCALSNAKEAKAEDMTDKAAYQKISAEEAYEMMASQEVVVVDVRTNPTRVRRVLAGLKKAGIVETREGLDGAVAVHYAEEYLAENR